MKKIKIIGIISILIMFTMIILSSCFSTQASGERAGEYELRISFKYTDKHDDYIRNPQSAILLI